MEIKKILRASKAGYPCARNLYYSVNGYEGITDLHTQRIFDVGTYLEPLVVRWLQEDGWTVYYNQGSQDADLELKYPVNGGELAGHPDCFISREGTGNLLIDIKTMNERAFQWWKRDGSIKSKPQYVDQLHIYAAAAMKAGFEVDKLGIVGLNKNNSDLWLDTFDYDEKRFNDIINRAEYIFMQNKPPAENCPRESWCCGYCEYSEICEISQSKRDTHVNDGAMRTDDPEIISAMKTLKEARELSKTARELEDEAKSTLDSKVRQQGLSSVQGGGFTVNITERHSTRFDTSEFKRAHPELVSLFSKNNTALFYEIKSQEEN